MRAPGEAALGVVTSCVQLMVGGVAVGPDLGSGPASPSSQFLG